MFSILEIKSRYDLTWEDLPYIEAPAFAHHHAFKAIQGRDPYAPPVQNIEDFRRAEVPHYDPFFNHDYVENHLRHLFFEGLYFSISRPKIPLAPIFNWRPIAEHPDGGEWIADPTNYSEYFTQKLEEYAKYLGAQRRRKIAEQEEADATPASLVAGVKRVVEKREKIEAAPTEVTPQFKRTHEDGYEKDAYTLQADGKPLGAQEGIMPRHCQGLTKLPDNHELLVEQGYPNLDFEWSPGVSGEDYANFSDVRPDVLPPGTKLYRIVDEKVRLAGGYWATELPESKANWRCKYAVKDSWNDNGYYTEYTVPPGGGLKVWRGTTAGQKYQVSDGKKFYLEGGREQIYISPNTIVPAPKKLTPWTDANS